MGSLKRKLEGEVEIRSTASEVFHEAYGSKPHHLTIAAPHIVESVDLDDGKFGEPGHVILWKFTSGGKPIVAKCVIEEIDKDKKLVKQRVIEGTYLEDYKSMVAINQVIPKDNETSIVRWTLEYEKLHPEIPEPSDLMDTVLIVAKEIDDHHHGIKK